MKVCFISPAIGGLLLCENGVSGGAERQFFLFGKELIKHGIQVSYITSDTFAASSIEREAAQDFQIEFASFSWMNGNKLHLFSSFISVIRAANRLKADFYIIKTPALLLFPLLFYRFFSGRKVVFWAQTSHDAQKIRIGINKTASAIQNLLLKRVDLVISQTQEQQTLFQKNFNIDSPLIRNLYIEEHAPSDTVSSDVFWCGNSSANKRQEIVYRLAEIMPQYKFCIAMNNSSTERFDKARATAEKMKNIIFLGSVPQNRIFQYFSSCRLFLNTSFREGFPNTFLQAFDAGKPVVSVCIDPDHILRDYDLGLCLSNDIQDINQKDVATVSIILKDHLDRLLQTDLLPYKKRCEDYLHTHHDPVTLTKELVNILSSVR